MILNDIQSAIELMRKHQVKPAVVKSTRQARDFNRHESALAKLFGTAPHKWRVGEEYYIAYIHESYLA